MVVRNSMAYPQTLQKKTSVAREVAATPVLGPPMKAQLQEGGRSPRTLTSPNWLSGKDMESYLMNSWPLELADTACWLLAKYHNVFLLDPMGLGCTYSTKHTIKVTDDTPFKEWFWWIPLPLVKEVWSHLLEMLESDAIWPSQSMWCNAVVLVRKKDGGLWFCIDFHHLNVHMKKDSYHLSRIQEALEC